MKKRLHLLALALLIVPALAGASCSKLQAKMAMQDGNRNYEEENFRLAIEDYQRAVQLDSNFAEAWFYLGSSHQALYRPGKDTPENREHLEKAIESYKRSLDVNRGESPNQKKVRANTLAALIGIHSDDPFKNYEQASQFANQLVQENPTDAKNLYAMANLYEKFDHVAEAEETYRKVAESNPNDTKACGALAAFLNKPLWDDQGSPWAEASGKPRRSKFDQAIEVLQKCAALAPEDASGYQKVASFFWDKAYRDPSLTDEQKDAYADKGLDAVNKALEIKPDYFEAVIYKGLLYRVKAAVAKNPRLRAQYLDQAATLQKQGLDLKRQQQEAAAAAAAAASPTPSP